MKRIIFLVFASLLTLATPYVAVAQSHDAQTAAFIENFVYSGKSLDISAETQDARTSFWNPEGTLLFVVGRRSNNLVVYQVSQAWQLHSAVFQQQVSLPGENQHGLYIRPDGQMMWVYDRTSIWWFQLSTPWDVATLSEGVQIDLSHFAQRGHDIHFRPDGRILFIDDRNAGAVFEYTLASPWDVTSGTLTYTLDLRDQQKEVRGVEFLQQGRLMLLMDTDRREVLQYQLAIPWEISTAVYTGSFDVSTQTLQGRGLSFSAAETTMYVTAQDQQMIFQYELNVQGKDMKD